MVSFSAVPGYGDGTLHAAFSVWWRITGGHRMPLVLSPWPTSPVALASAQTSVRNAIGEVGLSDDRLDALGATAAEAVQAYARQAPQVTKNEAVLRLIGWLKSEPTTSLATIDAGGVALGWRPGVGRNSLRLSGAMGLLGPWHRPRALVLEDPAS